MASEQQDDSQRAALWIVGLVVAAVLLVLVGRVVFNQLHHAKAPVAQGLVIEEELLLIDMPLSGEVVGTVFFAVAESAMPAEAAAELAKALEALAAAPSRKIVIAGFHDASGDPLKNAALAKARAIAARNALKAAGIDAARLQLRKPESALADGPAEQARRVEIRLLD
ncbi:outer membrane protein OmpA-like peptidoglycan-associated protein [Paucibacter oligotrophus]|uniref:Outer membrane protein OmpA-like peptidoglycan-associated protein n=1 Tax=Roseateles oligotrophus TaxID=1769250 RepID=A0A840L1E0_9BURK|nr:OmpA family protein [Roseateles oligotrophus]MBB4841716.1 outer membrane protein OmpA-like peptidoglycan-associated protein [Roseateles oligotrophus]